MKYLIISTLLSFFVLQSPGFSAEIQSPGQRIIQVLPEIATSIEVSNTDANRIICPTPITDIVFSKEKGLMIQYTKKDAFLKFKIIKKSPTDFQHAFIPSELFINCDDNIYHIIVTPKLIPSKTIRLASNTRKTIKKNRTFLNGLPLEEKVLKIIKAVYTDKIPDSFTVSMVNNPISIFQDIQITHRRTIKIDGEGLIIKEYLLKSKNISRTIPLKESDFLRSELTRRPMGLSIDILSLKPGHSARMIIIERQGGQSNG